MYWPIVAIIISSVGIIAMFLYRGWEMRIGRIPSDRSRTEGVTLPTLVLEESRIVFENLKKDTQTLLFDIVVPKTLSFASQVKEKVKGHPKVQDLSSMIRGTKVLSSNGNASDFIRTISEHKNETKGNGGEEVSRKE